MRRILALDLGGTRLRAAIAEEPQVAEPCDLGAWPSPTNLASFKARVEGLLQEAAGVDCIGLAVPGLVEGPRCRWVPNLPWLDGVDIAALFPAQSVAVGNDAQIALLAEAARGAAAGLSDVLLLSIGTGIGSAVLAGGRIVRGARGGACSFGWACADASAPVDPRSGWLERAAAGPAFDALAFGVVGRFDGRALMELAQRGDERAQRALFGPASALGLTLAGAVALLDPETILLTGGIAESFDAIAPMALAALRERLPPHLRAIGMRPGHFGARAPLVGAALAAASAPEWWSLR